MTLSNSLSVVQWKQDPDGRMLRTKQPKTVEALSGDSRAFWDRFSYDKLNTRSCFGRRWQMTFVLDCKNILFFSLTVFKN